MREFAKMLICLASAAGFALPLAAHSHAYPSKPVRVIVPLAAGGGVDLIARTVCQKLTEIWKQQVIIDNRTGAGGNIGADAVAKAVADGYTLLVNQSGQAISASLYRRLPFDPRKDFAPITEMTSTGFILVVDPKLPAASMAALIELAKSQPGKLNFGSSGSGTALHLAGELLRISAGIDIVHVPYKGDANVIPAMLSGEVQMAFFPLSSVLQLMKEGRVRGMAISGASRSSLAPEIPTIAESGVRDFQYTTWVGMFAPAGTPRELLNRISADTVKSLNAPEVRDRLSGLGYQTRGTTPEEFSARYLSDIEMYAKVIKAAGVPQVD